jgi:hypothetical protein
MYLPPSPTSNFEIARQIASSSSIESEGGDRLPYIERKAARRGVLIEVLPKLRAGKLLEKLRKNAFSKGPSHIVDYNIQLPLTITNFV